MKIIIEVDSEVAISVYSAAMLTDRFGTGDPFWKELDEFEVALDRALEAINED